MRNTYTLSGTLNGESVSFRKKFASRNEAIDYMFKYYDKHFVVDSEIDYTVEVAKHNISYICTNGNQFNVRRSA